MMRWVDGIDHGMNDRMCYWDVLMVCADVLMGCVDGIVGCVEMDSGTTGLWHVLMRWIMEHVDETMVWMMGCLAEHVDGMTGFVDGAMGHVDGMTACVDGMMGWMMGPWGGGTNHVMVGMTTERWDGKGNALTKK